MTKKEFVAFLNQRLSVLDQKERQEIIDEYVQHIEIKVESGKSEEEAIKDFGDLNEFVDEILSAYHVNPNRSNSNFIYDFLESLGKFINRLASSILKMDSNQLIRLAFEVIILVIVLSILKWPVSLLLSFVFDILYFLPGPLSSLLVRILSFLFEICYFIIVCFVVYIFAKDKIGSTNTSNGRTVNNDTPRQEEQVKKNRVVDDSDTVEFVKKESESKEQIVNAEQEELKAYRSPEEIRSEKKVEKNDKKSNGFERIAMGIIKFFLLIILIPGVILMILQFMGFGFILGLLLKGASILGLFLILGGTLVITIGVVSSLGSFIFRGDK